MKIEFHGAAQEVTGSMHLIEVNGKRILLDCGLYQGRRADTYERNLNFPFSPASIDALILSHAHIDHSGNIPNLCKQGFTRQHLVHDGDAQPLDLHAHGQRRHPRAGCRVRQQAARPRRRAADRAALHAAPTPSAA